MPANSRSSLNFIWVCHRFFLLARDRLPQPLHGEFDVLRLQMPPAFNLSLVAILREALKVFRSVLAGGVALPREFLADERVCWHNLPSTPEIFNPTRRHVRVTDRMLDILVA